MRFSPEMNYGFIKNHQMPVYIGGAELNVATALQLWNVPTKYVTALPDNYFAKEIVDDLQMRGINTTAIHFAGERIGSYYLPQGKDLKNNAVIYDRNYSSFSQLKPGDLHWDEMLQDVSWLHISAISPALNSNVANLCLEAVKAAKAMGITVSIDLNYRSKLWQYGKQPIEVMPAIVQYCDVIMGNIWAAESLLGIAAPIKESIGQSKEQLIVAAKESMVLLQQQYPNASSFAYTFRLDERYFAVLQQQEITSVSATFPIEDVVDKVGSGDCFMGALIYGMHLQHTPEYIINYAAAAAIAKLQQKGDVTSSSIQHIEDLIKKHHG